MHTNAALTNATSSTPTTVSISVCGGDTYQAHKNVLVKDSKYFEKATDGKFIGAETLKLDLDDVESSEFGFYLTAAYNAVLQPDVVQSRTSDGNSYSHAWDEFGEILGLWKLADRFLNSKVKTLAAKTLHDGLASTTSAAWWYDMYLHNSWDVLEAHVQAIQGYFRMCVSKGLPFEDDFVVALSNCPPEVLAECANILDKDFATATLEQFALRMASKMHSPGADARRNANLAAWDIQDRPTKSRRLPSPEFGSRAGVGEREPYVTILEHSSAASVTEAGTEATRDYDVQVFEEVAHGLKLLGSP